MRCICPNADKSAVLAKAIRAIFQKGLVLSPDALHYIDSTFSTPSLDEIRAILHDDFNCEKEPLLELIFFPDEALQVALEELLESCPYQKEDEANVLGKLFAEKLETTLVFPGRHNRLTLEVPRDAAAQFVSRLNIAKKIDPKLIAAIGRHIEDVHQKRFKVRLRNARSAFRREKVAFLCAFFEKMKADITTALDAMDFLLEFFDEMKDDTDIYRALMEKKRFYFQNRQKAVQSDELLQAQNIETLIFQGARIVHFDKHDARKKMQLIDRISQAVFGRTENLEQNPADVDLGDFNQKDGLKKMFQILS